MRLQIAQLPREKVVDNPERIARASEILDFSGALC